MPDNDDQENPPAAAPTLASQLSEFEFPAWKFVKATLQAFVVAGLLRVSFVPLGFLEFFLLLAVLTIVRLSFEDYILPLWTDWFKRPTISLIQLTAGVLLFLALRVLVGQTISFFLPGVIGALFHQGMLTDGASGGELGRMFAFELGLDGLLGYIVFMAVRQRKPQSLKLVWVFAGVVVAAQMLYATQAETISWLWYKTLPIVQSDDVNTSSLVGYIVALVAILAALIPGASRQRAAVLLFLFVMLVAGYKAFKGANPWQLSSVASAATLQGTAMAVPVSRTVEVGKGWTPVDISVVEGQRIRFVTGANVPLTLRIGGRAGSIMDLIRHERDWGWVSVVRMSPGDHGKLELMLGENQLGLKSFPVKIRDVT